MRKLSPEQEAARVARKEKFKALWQQVAKMGDSEKAQFAAKFGFVTCEGHALSLCNQMLVALQSPGATVLGGFRQWIKQGRAVRKGEHGVMIWVPIGTRANNAEAQDPQSDGDADRRFIVGTIFDISQTQEIETDNPEQNEAIVEHAGNLATV